MSNELFDAFRNDDKISANDIISLKKGYNKKTGSIYIKATTTSGATYLKTFTKDGIEINQEIDIPYYETKKERNKYIQQLYKEKYTQEEIADMLGISQATVHNVLKKKKKKEKKSLKI